MKDGEMAKRIHRRAPVESLLSSSYDYAHAETKGRKPKMYLIGMQDKMLLFHKSLALCRCIFSLSVSAIDNVRLVKLEGGGMAAHSLSRSAPVGR